MLYSILIFFLFLGPLVFFHELGHFFFARLFGVRVETFSIGFGPKLFTWKRGDTVYAFSAIPLGGYVKMFGDDPLSEKELTPEEQEVAYTKKSKWARFWIIFGGPLANFILAFVLYFALATGGEKVPEPKLGVISQDNIFHGIGLRTGDVLKEINGTKIYNFDDVNIADSKIRKITVERLGENKSYTADMTTDSFQQTLLKSVSVLRAPVLLNPNGELFILKIKGKEISSFEELFALESSAFMLEQYPKEVEELKLIDPSKLEIKPIKSEEILLSGDQTIKEYLIENKLYPIELKINNVTLSSAAAEAGLKKGEIIVGINDNDIYSFDEFRSAVQELKEEKAMAVSVLSEEGLRKLDLTPRFQEYNGQKVLMVGVESGIIGYSKMIEFKADGFFAAISLAASRTVNGTINVVGMFKKLIFGEVSVNNLGGPIAIGKAANDYFEMGLSMFFRLMALISINLAVINLFPIPVLDGGHIVFILIELINRGPVSRKKLMVAQQFGMSLLFLLIFVAIFNDIKRFFL